MLQEMYLLQKLARLFEEALQLMLEMAEQQLLSQFAHHHLNYSKMNETTKIFFNF